MQQEVLFGDFASALLFETPEEIYARVFRELRPRTPAAPVEIRYCQFANVHSSIRMQAGKISVKMSDILEGAPAPVTEALAHILLSKLLRKAIDPGYSHRYKLFLNGKDVRGRMHLVRQQRGRKMLSDPSGKHYNLEHMFDRINLEYFDGLLGRPSLGWSPRRSRTMLGHYDPSHNTIVLSKIFDEPGVPSVAVEYVMFHEMLHLLHPVEHKGARRCVHTREFKAAEKRYPRLKEAREALKKLS